MMPPSNFNSVPLVPNIPVYSPTNADLTVPYQNVSLVVPVTPKENYPQINKAFNAVTATNNTQTLYTVPAGKALILFGASMSVVVDAAAGSQAKLYGPSTGDEILEFNSYAAASDAGIHQLNADFSIPIYFNEGESIYVKSQSALIHATGMIRGYVIDKFSSKSQVKLDEWLVFRGFLNIFK